MSWCRRCGFNYAGKHRCGFGPGPFRAVLWAASWQRSQTPPKIIRKKKHGK